MDHQVSIRFDDRMVKYDFGELDEIGLAYAVTIHKSQGSKFPAVVIPLATQHFILLQRNLGYTGITRGKKLVVLIGQKMALGITVRNDRPQRRYSGLLTSLRGASESGLKSHENGHPERAPDRHRTRPPRRLPRKLQGRQRHESRRT